MKYFGTFFYSASITQKYFILIAKFKKLKETDIAKTVFYMQDQFIDFKDYITQKYCYLDCKN